MKTLIACLNSADHAKDVLHAAVPIARRHDSHLIGLHTIEMLTFYPGVSVHIPVDIYTNFESAQEEDASAIKAIFDEMTQAEDFQREWRTVKSPSLEAADRIAEAAYTADLVVMAQGETNVDQSNQFHAQEHVIRRSGRPVLHVPAGYDGDGVGKKVVIGWSPTRETARAVHDALPLLSPGAEVVVATVAHGAAAGYEGATELARALDRHGFKAEVAQRTASRGQIAEELGEIAFETEIGHYRCDHAFA